MSSVNKPPRKPTPAPVRTRTTRSNAARNASIGGGRGVAGTPGSKEPKGKRSSWKALAENLGWGLVIGLPIILVILAILFRATNGFQGTPSAVPLPTPAPSPTAGSYFPPPAGVSGNKDRLLLLKSPSVITAQQLYNTAADGSNPIQLTNSLENKATPAWSPDGKQIAFTADSVGIQMVNFDGSGLHTLAYGGFNPVWSPDGKQIAFLKSVPAPDGQGPDRTGTVRILHVIKVDGKPGDEKQLAADALGHNWSADGKQIAFFSLRNAVMFTVEVESAKVTQIVPKELVGGWYPTFTPDGSGVVFYGNLNPTVMVNSLDLSVSSASIGDPGFARTTAATTADVTTAAATTSASGTVTGSTPGATGAAGTTAGATTPGSPTVAASPTPTVVPGIPSRMSLYQINRDGSGLKKLADLEPAGGLGGGKYAFSFYIATSADQLSVLTGRPYYKAGPVFAPDGKSIAAMYIGEGDKAGLALVPATGGEPNLLIPGVNNLEDGVRLGASFAADNRLLYTFIPAKTAVGGSTATPITTLSGRTIGIAKQLRGYVVGQPEQKIAVEGDNSWGACCGFNRN